VAERKHDSEFDARYERYGKPLEAEHWGEFVAIMADGRYYLAPDSLAAAVGAYEKYREAAMLYQVGPRVLGWWRTLFPPASVSR
jgi:hypothetical protein